MESIEEGFASDAQRRAAFASGYKAKGKKKGVEEEYAQMTNIDWLLNDLTWSTIIIPNTFDGVQSGEYNSAFDWNGDGVLDMADVQLAMDLWQQGLGVMYADDYQRMLADMEAGSRSNVNKGGAQMQIGTRFGSKTSRPPAAPPTTGSMRESVQLDEEFGPANYESAIDQMEGVLYMYKNPNFDPKDYFANNPAGQLFVSLYDYNGDGLVDYDDLTLLLSLESAGLPFMYAFTYNKYMDSDARSGAKQQRGAQMQLGTRFGSKTSRPPAAPPTTGNMREGVQLNEEPTLPPDEIWTRIILPQTLRYAQDPSLPYNSAFDWNGDGEITLADLNIAIQLWQQGLRPMLATQYLMMMANLDAKTGQRVGPKAPMNPLGTNPGSRPTQPPPPDMSGGAGGR